METKFKILSLKITFCSRNSRKLFHDETASRASDFCHSYVDKSELEGDDNRRAIRKGRRNHQRWSIKKHVLKNSQNSLENTSARVFFNKEAGSRPATSLKKRL